MGGNGRNTAKCKNFKIVFSVLPVELNVSGEGRGEVSFT